jgi:1,4-alpha-glucan branching enzyme
MARGYLAFVLHAHLPYVRSRVGALEERWFFEALTECYLPLLEAWENLAREGRAFRLTLSLSPPLLEMLADDSLGRRYVAHLDNLLLLAEKEVHRTANDPRVLRLARMYRENLERIRCAYLEEYQRNLLDPLTRLQREGFLELITTAATHGYLPLMSSESVRRAQIAVGVALFRRHFGWHPPGFWLPECGYVPGVEELLKEFGLRYFILDSHGVLNARPAPRHGVYAPVLTRCGVAALGRDPTSSRQVWDQRTGYPGDFYYREFYRDIGHDLDLDYLAPHLPEGRIRVDTGLKYYRITGPTADKALYEPDRALERAAEHAAHFVAERQRQVLSLARHMEVPPLVVAPYDAELFGHWWFEGPRWLELVLRRLQDQDTVALTTPARYLSEYPYHQVVDLDLSSWGEEGYNKVWLNPANDWIYRFLHRAEAAVAELADLYPYAAGRTRRLLNQAARELLLAQSSDWAFILHTGTAVQYARQRITVHLENLKRLIDELESGTRAPLENLEAEYPFAQDINYRVFSRFFRGNRSASRRRYRVVMFSWEYPPKTVGGLGRHVYDLSRALVRLGDDVVVLTCPASELPSWQVVDGVRVYRTDGTGAPEASFLDWVAWFNAALVDLAGRVLRDQGPFDLIHAHDWLVGRACLELRARHGLPLVTTIHATEHGRNLGLHNETQWRIHQAEAELARESDLIICCSRYMAREVTGLFAVDPEKVRVVPNGVEPQSLGVDRWLGRDRATRMVLFMGRLVPEKGVQVLLRAFARLRGQLPDLSLVVAGRGPYEDYLRQLAAELGLDARVCFAGFVDGTRRQQLYREAGLAVFPSLYEPFGIVALEAMAAQVPVIVSDTGGLSEVVEHGATGFKVPPGDVEALSYYMAHVFLHPEVSRSLCWRAWREILTRYNWQYLAQETREVYRELLAG